MKSIIKYIYLLMIPMVMGGALLSSCDEDDDKGGTPQIRYIRSTNPESADSLYVGAFLDNLIAIIGNNLGDVREAWFNDRQAELIPTYITNTSILVSVPEEAPLDINNTLKLVFANGFVLEHSFEVMIPPPLIASMKCEFVADGEEAEINGQYFFDVTPIQVWFTDTNGGKIEVAAEDITVESGTLVKVIVPEGAGSGPITMSTNFGTTESTLHFRDQRNIILNYDEAGKTPAGSWRTGNFVSDEHSLDGFYNKFIGVYTSPDRNEGGSPVSTYESQFWGQASGRPESNLLPGEPIDYVMKFEAKVVEWYGSYLNIAFAPWNHSNNSELWGNDLNARAIWGPWSQTNSLYDTDGEWVTVVIPMTEFKWAMGQEGTGVVYTPAAFDKNVTGSLSFWVLSAPQADASPFEFYIDNVRIVEK